ncbi:MAG: hypothetical protein IMF19_14620 [Proteobacteria bacterium]|nr:hypothetical protein [Pseudomonadota bacterium]
MKLSSVDEIRRLGPEEVKEILDNDKTAYTGWVLTYGKQILLVLECSDHLDKAVRYLVRLGYDNIVGYLRGGIEAWYDSGFTQPIMPSS